MEQLNNSKSWPISLLKWCLSLQSYSAEVLSAISTHTHTHTYPDCPMCLNPSDTLPYFTDSHKHLMGFPGGASGKESSCQCRRFKKFRFESWVRKIPLEEEMASHSSILTWKISWTEEPGQLQSRGLQRQDTTEPLSMQKCLIASPRWGWMSEAYLYVPFSEHRMFLLCMYLKVLLIEEAW